VNWEIADILIQSCVLAEALRASTKYKSGTRNDRNISFLWNPAPGEVTDDRQFAPPKKIRAGFVDLCCCEIEVEVLPNEGAPRCKFRGALFPFNLIA
jgi:hypothetical protein